MTMDTTTGEGEMERGASRLASLVSRLAEHGGAIAALSIRLGAAALGYGLQIILARMLGANDYGVFAWAWALVAVGGFSSTLGMSQTSVRHLAIYAVEGRAELARGFLRFSAGAALAASLIVALFGVSMSGLTPGERLAPLLLALAAIPFFTLGDMAEGYARSQGWTGLALAPPYLLRPALILAGLPLLWLLRGELTAFDAMAAALAATILTALCQIALVISRLSTVFGGLRTANYRPSEWLRAAAPVFVADLLQVLRQNMDVILLAVFAPAAVVGAYFAATRIASLLGLVEFAVGAAAAHRFAGAGQDARNVVELKRLAGEAAAMTFWPTALAGAALIFAAPLLLAFFGEGFAVSGALVVILSMGAVARAAIGPCDDLLVMSGHGASALRAQAISLVALVVLLIALTPPMGATGAAIAASLSQIACVFALASAARLKLGFAPHPFHLLARPGV